MKVMCFDLNTHTSGCFCAEIEGDKVVKVGSITIKSKPFIVSEHTPYQNSKKKMPTSKTGTKTLNSYYKAGETHVSSINKKKRDSEVRNKQNKHKLESQAEYIHAVVEVIKPDLIIGEKNEIFNGRQTIEILAKVYGQLMGVSAANSTKLLDLSVNEVRIPYQVSKLTVEYSKADPDGFHLCEDKAKGAISWYLENKYAHLGLKFGSLDESDAALLFDYWFNYIRPERGDHGERKLKPRTRTGI